GLSPNSNLNLTNSGYGVSLNTSTNVTRSIRTGPGQISFATGSGISAVGGNIVVAFAGLANPTALVLGQVGFSGGIGLNFSDNFAEMDFRNAIDTNGQNLSIGNGNNWGQAMLTMSGVISGKGSFSKGGSNGWLELAGANT